MLTAGIHGSEHRNWKRRTLRLSAPQPLVFPAAGSMPHGSPQPFFHSGPVLVTAFPSPATAPAFTAPIPGSMVPACYFAPSLAASRARSASDSATGPGLPRFRPPHRSGPLRLPRPRARLRLPPPLPFGTFTSLRIKAFNRICRPPTRLPTRPISVRSPQPFLLLGSATDHRSRSATFPEACCSSNLLEPPSICAWKPLFGQPFFERKRPFSSTFI